MRKLPFLPKVVTLALLSIGANLIDSPAAVAGGQAAAEKIALEIFTSEFKALALQSGHPLGRTSAGELLLTPQLFAAIAPKALAEALPNFPAKGSLIEKQLKAIEHELYFHPDKPEGALLLFGRLLVNHGISVDISIPGPSLDSLTKPSSEELLSMAESPEGEMALDETTDPIEPIGSETSPAHRNPATLRRYADLVYNTRAAVEFAGFSPEIQIREWVERVEMANVMERQLQREFPDFEAQVERANALFDYQDGALQTAIEKIESDRRILAEKVAKRDRETLRALRHASREIAKRIQHERATIHPNILNLVLIQRSASKTAQEILEIDRHDGVQAVVREISRRDKRVQDADIFVQIGHYVINVGRFAAALATQVTPTRVDDRLYEIVVKQIESYYDTKLQSDEDIIRRHKGMVGKTSSIGIGVVIVGGTVYLIGTEVGWWHRWDWLHEQMDDFMKWLKSLQPEEVDRILDPKPQPQTVPAPAK